MSERLCHSVREALRCMLDARQYYSRKGSSDAYGSAWGNHASCAIEGDAQTGAVLACCSDVEDGPAHGRWRGFRAGNGPDTVARLPRAARRVVGSGGAGAWTSPIVRMGGTVCAGGRIALSPTLARSATRGCAPRSLAAGHPYREPDLARRQPTMAFDDPGESVASRAGRQRYA